MIGTALQRGNGAMDAENGARFVVRHNYIHNAQSGQSWHGRRKLEAVGRSNFTTTLFIGQLPDSMLRSGNALWHDNNCTEKQAQITPLPQFLFFVSMAE